MFHVFVFRCKLRSINMERSLDKTLDDVMQNDGVIGCLISNKQGLCLGVKGKASTDSSGIICSIAEQARKLDPGAPKDNLGPVVLLENDHRQCLIQDNNIIVSAVYKTLP